MKKVLIVLGLLGFLSQPISAQQVTQTYTVPAGGATVQQTYTIPTGGAATVQTYPQTVTTTTATPNIQPVTIPKKHWWNRTRTGYMPVCPGVTGGAAPIGGNPCTTCSPVYIPKQHFWERDQVQMIQTTIPGCSTCPAPTGGAARINCPVQTQTYTRTQTAPMPTIKKKPAKTGGAAPVRGYW